MSFLRQACQPLEEAFTYLDSQIGECLSQWWTILDKWGFEDTSWINYLISQQKNVVTPHQNHYGEMVLLRECNKYFC